MQISVEKYLKKIERNVRKWPFKETEMGQVLFDFFFYCTCQMLFSSATSSRALTHISVTSVKNPKLSQ